MQPPSLAGAPSTAERARRRRAERLSALILGCLLAVAAAAPFVPRRAVVDAVGIRSEDVARAVIEEPVLLDQAMMLVLGIPELRTAVESRLTTYADAVYDSHLDPEVGRILLPSLSERPSLGTTVSTNAFGLREREYRWNRPEDVTRVVLLGDSFVFGHGGAVDERVGAYLETLLEPSCPTERLEVLNVAISSWNIQAECAYLRRQLGPLDPDLVIQVAYRNDLADSNGVRGMGVAAPYSTQAWIRGEEQVGIQTLPGLFEDQTWNMINIGLDWESRERYRRAASAVGELADSVESIGGKYSLVTIWGRNAPAAAELLTTELRDEQVAFVSEEFMSNADHWVSPTNRHWNGLGARRMADALVALIVERDLLPEWDLEATAAQRDEYEFIIEGGAREAADREDFEAFVAFMNIRPRIVFPPEDRRMASQFTGGVDRDGVVARHATLCLERGGTTLTIDGEPLDQPALSGARTRVMVDEFELGSLALDRADAFPAQFELPAEVADRDHVSVRLFADDYAYVVPRGRSGTFRLREVRID